MSAREDQLLDARDATDADALLDAARREGAHDPAKVTRLGPDDVAAREALASERAALPPDADQPSIDLGLLRQYRDLRERQSISEAEGKAYKDEANKLEVRLVEMFTDAELQNLSVDGKTMFLHRSVYAQRCAGIDAEAVKTVLLDVAPELVSETVNAQTLSSWVRELVEDDDSPGLPPALDGILEAGERFSIRINATAARPRGRSTRAK